MTDGTAAATTLPDTVARFVLLVLGLGLGLTLAVGLGLAVAPVPLGLGLGVGLAPVGLVPVGSGAGVGQVLAGLGLVVGRGARVGCGRAVAVAAGDEQARGVATGDGVGCTTPTIRPSKAGSSGIPRYMPPPRPASRRWWLPYPG
jgi:hypothetical protein